MRSRLDANLWLILGACCLLCAGAFAQPTPVGAVSPARGEAPSHAWALIERSGRPMLVHVPPRLQGPGFLAADPGAIRPVRQLVEYPDAMAAIDDRVYLFYPPTTSVPSAAQRPVFSLRAVPSAIAGMWIDLPTGLMDALPALPAKGRMIGVAAGGTTLYALERSPGRLGFWSLDTGDVSGGWVELENPIDIAGDEPLGVAVVSFGDGVLLAARYAPGVDAVTEAWHFDAEAGWALSDLGGWDSFWDARWRQGFGREVLVALASGTAAGSGTDLDLWRLGSGDPIRVGTLNNASSSAIVALPAPGRLVLIRQGEASEEGGVPEPISVQEISLVTGRSLHDGPSAASVPVPLNELRIIALILLVMMAGVLIVIIRPNPDRAWSVPEGWVLADPGRRLIASVVDLMLVVVVLAPAFGVTARQVLTLEVLIHPSNAWLVLPATLVAGWVSMSVWEAMLGLTPGKFVMGCRVHRATGPAPARLPLFWCLVRNAMKWLTPPVAALALFDSQGRHRGDAAARAVVTTLAPDEPAGG